MRSRLPLSVALITLDEEANLPRCLESVAQLASEIVVIDSGSEDRTGEIARGFGARFKFEPWRGHVAQKNLALQGCAQPWVLCLDADEVVSPELAEAISAVLTGEPPRLDGFWINRRTFYLGQWVRHAWYPEWRLRLVRRDKALWQGRDPHDRLAVEGATSRLTGELLHYSYRDLSDHLDRMIRYARTSADGFEQQGRGCHWYHLAISPWLALGKRLLLKQGFRDGKRGWIIAYSAFFSVVAKYAFLFEKELNAEHEGRPATPPPPEKPPGTERSRPA